MLYQERKKQYDSFSHTTTMKGVYKVCFSNEFSTFSHKTVYLDFRTGDDDRLMPDMNKVTALTQVRNTNGIHSYIACTVHICIWYEPLNKSCRWSQLACLFMRSWKWFQILRLGTVFGRLRTESGLKTWVNAFTFGPLGRPSSCLWSVLARCLCLRVSSVRRKPMFPLAHRPSFLVSRFLSVNQLVNQSDPLKTTMTKAYNQPKLHLCQTKCLKCGIMSLCKSSLSCVVYSNWPLCALITISVMEIDLLHHYSATSLFFCLYQCFFGEISTFSTLRVSTCQL